MAESLSCIFNELQKIRAYLIKIGPSRRTGNIVIKKTEELKQICDEYNRLLKSLKAQIQLRGISSTQWDRIDW